MTQNSFGLNSAAVSDRGLSEKRPQNEDSYLEIPARGLFAVADGVGGAQAGDVASQMAVEILQEAFANLPEGGDVEDLMKLAIERANSAIYQMSQDLPQLSTMATTVVALHVDGNIATIGHVGDSRLYRVDSRGNLFRETNDHSVVEEEVRAGRMTAAQALHHPSRNVISRALGAETSVEVDLKTIMIEPNTTFLLCSDGITRHIEDHELRELLKSENSPAEICDDMKNICYGRGAEDNLTAVIARVAGATAETLSDGDAEELTVAALRPQTAADTGVFADAAAGSSESATILNPGTPAQNDFQVGSFEDYDDDYSSAKLITPANDVSANADAEEVLPAASTDSSSAARSNVQENKQQVEKAYPVKANSAVSNSGKWLAPLILGLLIGAVLGAIGYSFLRRNQSPAAQQSVQETPRITQMQTPNIAYSAFEDNRRNVDRNPEQFIATNGATANDAEDFYLMGRANLLTGKYVQAKEGFTKAKELLPRASGADKAMLANEIALGLSIVDSSFSKKVLEAERKGAAAQNQQADANTTPDTEIKPLAADNANTSN